MSWNDEKQARLAQINNAKAYLHNARGSADRDDGATAQEIALSDRAYIAVRDWGRHLQLEKSNTASGLPAVAPQSKPSVPDLSSTNASFVRIGARLDKIEALFEKLVEQDHARLASRDQFNQTVLAQLRPLQNAVTLLLSRDAPSLAEKIQAAKAIRDAADPESSAEAKS